MSTLDEFYAGGPKTWNEAFPPFCLRTHWDPTALSKHVLPTPGPVQLAMDPRQSVRICTTYYNTSAKEDKGSVLPPGGGPGTISMLGGGSASLGFPYAGFNSQAESDLQLLHLPLTRCSERKYSPPQLLDYTNAVPGAHADSLSPLATVVSKQAGCRAADDQAAWSRSSRLFFNPTKYDRTHN